LCDNGDPTGAVQPTSSGTPPRPARKPIEHPSKASPPTWHNQLHPRTSGQFVSTDLTFGSRAGKREDTQFYDYALRLAVAWTPAVHTCEITPCPVAISVNCEDIAQLVRELSASYAAFDVLAVARFRRQDSALWDRRALLEEAAGTRPPAVSLPAATDP
jgi:hypothetical protein